MDRLSVVVAFFALVGCKDGSADGGEGRGGSRRVVGVAAKPEVFDPRDFCEVYKDAGEAKTLSYPELDRAASAPGGPRWINVWATWCAPCIEELPRIRQWTDQLKAQGQPVDLMLLAADEAEAVDAFAAEHELAKGSLRFSDPSGVESWMQANGLPATSVLPLHLFVDGRDRLRCLRTGGVAQGDYEQVVALLAELD